MTKNNNALLKPLSLFEEETPEATQETISQFQRCVRVIREDETVPVMNCLLAPDVTESCIITGDSKKVLAQLPDGVFQSCITSPPYWSLRNYHIDGQIGLELSFPDYIRSLVGVFEEVRRVLRDDATLWLNIGDSFTSGGRTWHAPDKKNPVRAMNVRPPTPEGLKPKDLIGVPWKLAFALQEAGWYLRTDIVWCLSGGTWVYAKTQKGATPMMIRDIARLDPATVELWNGETWTQLCGISKSARTGTEIEFLLRSGERISCTSTHQFPTQRGLLEAISITKGDILQRCRLPEPASVKDCAIGEDAAWFAGLYIAEGSRAGYAIQISGHANEEERWIRIRKIAHYYGGSASRTISGNCMNIRVYGRFLCAILDELVTGRTAKDKAFAPVVWRYSNVFLAEMVQGYLDGDGHLDEKNRRWRLSFTRNYNLERDLRTACARLGYTLTLNMATVRYNGKQAPTFRGELRMMRSGHFNEREMGEVVEIRKARCRELYDIGVTDESHLFALASGVLTHNSKPNCQPESVNDRPTRCHEYLFLLTKSERYYYDPNSQRGPNDRNFRTVWDVNTQPCKEAHFATFPPALVQPCLALGSRPGDLVLDPFIGSGTTGLVPLQMRRRFVGIELNPFYVSVAEKRLNGAIIHA